MKPHHDFTAQRPLAQHAGLIRPGEAQAFDPASALAALSQRLASALPEALGVLGGEMLPEVSPVEPREGVMRELLSRGAAPCSHAMLAAEAGEPHLLVSIDTAGALQLVDMAFGGEGKLPDPVPEKLPLSAQLLLARIEAQVAALVARIAGIDGSDETPAFALMRRDADIAALRPFAADCALWQLGFAVSFGEAEAWTLRLTFAAHHAPLLCESDAMPGPVAASARKSDTVPVERTFDSIPLTLRATLVDMRIPLARIATLKPGDVLPVSVARQVPLAVGEATVARGTVGEVDDRVAIQIIHAFSQEETRS